MSATAITEEQVLASLKDVVDPEIGRKLSELGMLTRTSIGKQNAIEVEVTLPTPAYPKRERITDLVKASIKSAIPESGDVSVTFSWKVRGLESGQRIGLRVKNVIAVGSGKGGVGKSTTAAALAYGLKHFGAKVGLMDADVYGPSIPHMVGATGEPSMVERRTPDGQVYNRIEPVEHDGLRLMSIGFMVKPEQAVVWRGPMLHKLLTQFLQETEWGELDYLIIDLPPGTGDVALTLSQLLGLAGAVIVCTPQKVALLDAVKAVNMFEQVKIPLLGVIENMTGEMFGRGGARQLAKDINAPFLGEIPSDADIRIKGDEGKISELFDEECPARAHLLHITEQVAIQIAKQLLETPTMPTLEIL
jgi:ATP-binding protein involved in chromosome partitioning